MKRFCGLTTLMWCVSDWWFDLFKIVLIRFKIFIHSCLINKFTNNFTNIKNNMFLSAEQLNWIIFLLDLLGKGSYLSTKQRCVKPSLRYPLISNKNKQQLIIFFKFSIDIILKDYVYSMVIHKNYIVLPNKQKLSSFLKQFVSSSFVLFHKVFK